MQAFFIAFPAADYDQSKRFYEQALRLPILREHQGEPHRCTNYDFSGLILKVYEWLAPYHGNGHTGLGIATDDLDDAVERVARFGAAVTEPEVHPWGGRCASVTDPFGNIFTLIAARQKGDA
ncbi:MAG: VOC family protein [Gammaproteobacteria bacterium]|nr:VOC family protein [Gammaproteobacteria bacterium]NNL99287.1 VOC family protein [Gammaproteobacteria bacterium]